MEKIEHRLLQVLNRKVILNHILAISCFIGYEITTLYIMKLRPSFGQYFVSYLLEFATFYTSLYVVLPFLQAKGKVIKFAFWMLILITIHVVLRRLAAIYPNYSPIRKLIDGFTLDRIMLSIWRAVYIIGISLFYWLIKRDGKKAIEKKQLEIDKLEAISETMRLEIALLHSQLNPHLLANTLAFIQTNSEDTAPAVSRAVELLAEISRYAMLDVNNIQKVQLDTELEQISNLIALHSMLYNKQLVIDITKQFPANETDTQIPPNLLLTLVDNMFKHGIVNNDSKPASIAISRTAESFNFATINFKRPYPATPSSGLGLKNVRSILQYYYPDKHILNTEETATTYALSITIEL